MADYLLTSEIVPVKYIFPTKVVFNSSSLNNLQQMWNLEHKRRVGSYKLDNTSKDQDHPVQKF